MSRYKPAALRNKRQASTNQTTTRTVAKLGLRIAAFFCWFFAVMLCVLAGRNLMENHTALGPTHWEPIAFV